MSEQAQKTVVVTGGSRGIGRTICCELATPGTTIYFNYFNPGDPEGEAAAAAETEKMVAELGAVAKSSAVDVSASEDVTAFFNGILSYRPYVLSSTKVSFGLLHCLFSACS